MSHNRISTESLIFITKYPCILSQIQECFVRVLFQFLFLFCSGFGQVSVRIRSGFGSVRSGFGNFLPGFLSFSNQVIAQMLLFWSIMTNVKPTNDKMIGLLECLLLFEIEWQTGRLQAKVLHKKKIILQRCYQLMDGRGGLVVIINLMALLLQQKENTTYL